MAKKSIDPAIARAHDLMDWLATLDLPNRTSNALRRDLEVTLGIRAGKEGSGALAAMDQAQFVAELYRANGGKIRKIPGIADTAISALRAVIAPPAGVPDPTADDFTLPPLEDEEPAPATRDDDTALHPAVHFGADPEEDDHTDDLEALAQLDAAPSAGAAPARRVPRRRGRPPRSALPAEPPAAPHTEPTQPRATPPIALVTSQPLRLEAPAVAPLPVSETIPVSEEQRLLQLWSALHPQGRRATLGFIATLVAEEG